MPVQIIPSPNATTLVVSGVRVDFSLQRHYYPFLDGAQAKPQNSILYATVSNIQVQADLRSLGDLIEQRMLSPNISNLAAGAARARLMGAGVKEAAAKAMQAQLHDDYRVQSGRTWRVDNVAMNRLGAPNHCYPIAGLNLWTNVSQTEFAAAAALRWLERELEMKGVRDTLSKKWNSMLHMSNAEQNINSLFRAISGARTHTRQGNLSGNAIDMLGQVSGRADLLKELAKIQ